MTRLRNRLDALEAKSGQVSDVGTIDFTTAEITELYSNPKDVAAMDRIEAGDEGGYADMSDRALDIIIQAGGRSGDDLEKP